jgi:hypothetical protein
VEIRILINHPENEALPPAVDAEYGNIRAMWEQMTHTWTYFNSLRNELPEDVRPRFQVARLRTGVMHIALRRFDESMYILHYLYSQRSADTPVFVIADEEKPLFNTYMEEFGRLFRHAQLTAQQGAQAQPPS